MQRRLQRLEKHLATVNTISQEERTCRYFQLCQDPEATNEQQEEAFQHVAHVLPAIHRSVPVRGRGRHDA